MISGSVNLDICKIIVAHEFTLNKNFKCEYENGREYYGIIYCIEGEATYKFSSGKSCDISAGDIIMLTPEASYSIITKNDFRHYTVNFEIHNKFSDTDFFTDDFCLLHSDNHELYHHLFKKLVNHRISRKLCFEMQEKACLYELLSLVISEILENRYHTNTHMRLSKAKEYIEKNYNSDITLDILANLSDMSVTNFRREWLKLYRETALAYRDKLRLLHAKEYLFSGYYTVTEVAHKCGFDDVNYFIRFFKKHTGISPGKFGKISQ